MSVTTLTTNISVLIQANANIAQSTSIKIPRLVPHAFWKDARVIIKLGVKTVTARNALKDQVQEFRMMDAQRQRFKISK